MFFSLLNDDKIYPSFPRATAASPNGARCKHTTTSIELHTKFRMPSIMSWWLFSAAPPPSIGGPTTSEEVVDRNLRQISSAWAAAAPIAAGGPARHPRNIARPAASQHWRHWLRRKICLGCGEARKRRLREGNSQRLCCLYLDGRISLLSGRCSRDPTDDHRRLLNAASG